MLSHCVVMASVVEFSRVSSWKHFDTVRGKRGFTFSLACVLRAQDVSKTIAYLEVQG